MIKKDKTTNTKDLSIGDLLKELEKIQKKLEANKKNYERVEQIVMTLKNQDLSNFGYEVVDNFKEKNVVFRPAGVRRFELKKAS